MALVRFDTPWDSQPQEVVGLDPRFTWGVDFARGIASIEVASKQFGTPSALTGMPVSAATPQGVGISLGPTQQENWAGPVANIPTAFPITFVSTFRLNTLSPGTVWLFQSGMTSAYAGFFVWIFGDGSAVFGYGDNSGTGPSDYYQQLATAGTFVAGRTYTVAARFESLNVIFSINGTIYTDFISDGTCATIATVGAPNVGKLLFGGVPLYTSAHVTVLLVAAGTFYASDSQLNEFSANPWQIFAPRQTFTPFVTRTPKALVNLNLPWDLQPQEAVGVDWLNPLAASLGFLYDGASGREVARNFSIDEGKVAQGVGRAGRGQYSPSTNLGEGHLVFDTDANTSFANITVFALFEPTADPGVNTFFFSRGTQTTPTFGLGVSGGAAKGYRFALNRLANPDFNGNPIVDIGTVPLRPAFLAMTYDGTSLRCYVDGVDVGGSSGHGAISQDGPSNGVTLFDYVYRSTSIGILYLAGVCSKAFSAQEIAQLSANPWQLFAPRQIWIPATAAASFNPTLSLPTYVPGSLTSSAFRPRVTATWS